MNKSENLDSNKALKSSAKNDNDNDNQSSNFFKHHPLEQTLRFNEQSIPNIKILYRDSEFLIVDKPYDMRIDGETNRGPTVQSSLYHHHPTLPAPLRNVHQIDHATSGCYCLALTSLSASLACVAFMERRVRKTYLAMVRGWMKEVRYVVEQPIAQVVGNRYRMCLGSVDNPGKTAKTEIEVYQYGHFNLASYPPITSDFLYSASSSTEFHSPSLVPSPQSQSKPLSPISIPVTLVRLTPITGRRHQLRLHCQYLGHPIVGDWHYEKEIMDYTDTFRMMLHAKRLVIPLDGGRGKKHKKRNNNKLKSENLVNEKKEGDVLDVETDDPFIGLVELCEKEKDKVEF
ncbi:1179_t:CDS:2 [Ambispora gerdemannii]|uniref:1179_t:CDS:1 n=1 Tax=Ambispora gerdemannii TaxID=144530 RepID=A0A9N9BWJ3_9GLOM|nr:1179_t:CDS:2 [Ambispora gerdemannii]